MERLTERPHDEVDSVWVKDHNYVAAAHRLADYEDTGLTPEEITHMITDYNKTLSCETCPLDSMRWISVEDRLPEDESCVLICAIDNSDGGKEIAISAYSEVVFGGQKLGYKLWAEPYLYFFRNHEVTHWMPLPQPPKGEE